MRLVGYPRIVIPEGDRTVISDPPVIVSSQSWTITANNNNRAHKRGIKFHNITL
jgi:hypothetical protein